MSELKKVAICVMIAKVNSAPKIVALYPQLEELDEGGFQITPPGFHIIPLPFSDDIRHLHFNEMQKADEKQIEIAKKVVHKLELKNFSSIDYENPSLFYFYIFIFLYFYIFIF
jgi:ATP-dependent DNA helicase 2 subunit 1